MFTSTAGTPPAPTSPTAPGLISTQPAPNGPPTGLSMSSSWPETPYRALSSWNGWIARPSGIEYRPAGIEPVCIPWFDISKTIMAQATYNWIYSHSTYRSPAVLRGFERIVKATLGTRL